ncbi:MAG: sialidase family protein [Chloroflexota bacterium]
MKRVVVALVFVSNMLLLGSHTASATMSGHEVSVSNPFAGCVGVGTDVFGGINYPNTEPEPWVASNPANPDNMIGSFQQDRWSDGGAKGLVAGWSFNNGHTWGVTALPFSKCAAPYYGGVVLPYDRASDAWNSTGPDGNTYAVSISFDGNDNNNAVGAATSSDGGVTWHNQQAIQTDLDADPTQPFNDKESVTADPNIPGTAYAVWDRLVLVNCGVRGRSRNSPMAEDRKWRGAQSLSPAGSKSAAGNQALLCFEGPTYFSKTVDGGVTWSPPRPIVENTPDEQTIANQIVVDPKTGRLYDFYVYFAASGRVTVEDIFSDNGGTTWSPRQTINDLASVGIHDPQTGAPARTGDVIPEPAVDPNTGQLYVAWQDGRFNANGQDDVVISTSIGGGVTGTWTAPQRVNLAEDRAGFTPGIKVNSRGQVAVDYFSMRHPDLGPGVWPIDRYIRISDGPAVVAPALAGQDPAASFSFRTPTHDAGPFNLLMAPNAGGYFVGDYESMTIDRDGRSFHTFFAQDNCDTTNCPSVGNPTGAPEPGTSSPPDPMDVYTNQYFKN